MENEPPQDESAPSKSASTASMRARIASVTGRDTADRTRGLPAVHEIAFELPDGSVHEFGMPSSGEKRHLRITTPIFAQSFTVCPICLNVPVQWHGEHVPQGPLGGEVMTSTCGHCNNVLGSRVERDLQDWFDHSVGSVRFAHESVRGSRRTSRRLLARKGPQGVMMMPEGEIDPEIRRAMEAGKGEFQLSYSEPDPRRWRMALLKHAYLAACLYLGYIPDIADARAIRAELIAVRDADKRTRPAESEYAQRLGVHRSGAAPDGPTLAIVETEDGDEHFISLAGTLFVSWPFDCVPPRKYFQALPMF